MAGHRIGRVRAPHRAFDMGSIRFSAPLARAPDRFYRAFGLGRPVGYPALSYDSPMKAFIHELRERSVVKVGVTYLIAAWVVLQLADVLFPAMRLPEWAITLVLGLLVVGFPVAVGLAWAFDVTPDGVRRAGATGDDQKAEARDDAGASTPQHDQSIAVLPFPDMSAERDQEHFCDGLTDELLNVLTRIPNLRVASRTSSFAFKGKAVDLASVSDKLGVAHILEGSVRKSGNKVRITAQLIEVATDSNLWSQTYDRELDDIFAIQDDIAARILEVLELKLGTRTPPDPTTGSAKAYEYFLRGRGYAITKGREGHERATEMFREAVAVDPGFVRAWTELAHSRAMRAIYFGGGQRCRKAADEASEKAMRLAPDRAGSYMARGYAHLASERFADAESDFSRAIEIDPGKVDAFHYLARTAYLQGQMDKAREYFERATEVNPDDYESALLSIGIYEKADDIEGARRAARIGVERVERHLEDYPDNQRAYYLGASGLMTLGDMERAKEWAERALTIDPGGPATRYNLACFYARAGEPGKALDCLEHSITSRSWIANDPDLASLHDHPRFAAILETLSD